MWSIRFDYDFILISKVSRICLPAIPESSEPGFCQFRAKAVTAATCWRHIFMLDETVLNLVAEHIRPNPFTFLRLSHVSRSFRRVFTSDHVWRFLNPHGIPSGYCDRFRQHTDPKQLLWVWKPKYILSEEPFETKDLDVALGAILSRKLETVIVPASQQLFWCGVHIDGGCLEWVPSGLEIDLETQLVASRTSPWAVTLPEGLCIETVLTVIEYHDHHRSCPSNDCYYNEGFLESIPEHLRYDERIALAMVRTCGRLYYKLPLELQTRRDIVMLAAKTHGNIVANSVFLNNREVVLLAVETGPRVLEYAGTLQDDKEIVQCAVKREGYALEFASERLRDDAETVMLAVSQDGVALYVASRRLQDTEEIVQAAITNNEEARQYASKRLGGDGV